MAKFKFISPLPSTIINSQDQAESTLNIEDNWGRFEKGIGEIADRGFTLVRVKDPVTHEVQIDEQGNDCMEVRVIGPSHVKWNRYFVLVRQNLYEALWAAHLPAALNMLYENRHCGESHDLDDQDIDWIKAEAEVWVRENRLPFRNAQGKLTRAGRTLLELSVVAQVGEEFKLVSELSEVEKTEIEVNEAYVEAARQAKAEKAETRQAKAEKEAETLPSWIETDTSTEDETSSK
jgi:hypothetical protein